MTRLRRILKWLGIVAGAALALLLVFNAFFVSTMGSQLAGRLDALRQDGDPVRLADLARKPIPSERNADVYLRRAADDLAAIQKELTADFPDRGYPTGPVSPADQEKLENLFAAYPKVMPLVEQAADCPDNDPQLDFTLPTSRFLGLYFENTGKHRLLNRVMRARSAWLLSKGRNEDAVATQLLMLRLTRHWRREPLIPGYLVTAVCELGAMESVNQVLQAGPILPSVRQALDTELVLHDTMDGYDWALRSERAYSLSAVSEMPGSGFWPVRGLFNDLMLRLLELYDRYLKKASTPFAEVISTQRSAIVSPGGMNPYGALVTLLEPGLIAVREPAERTRALSRALRVLNAIQARGSQNSDYVPKLTELGLPEEATIDPFNGQPLHLKKLPEGWMVYSVGRNLVDDGGVLDYKHDLGAGPIKRKEPQEKPGSDPRSSGLERPPRSLENQP